MAQLKCSLYFLLVSILVYLHLTEAEKKKPVLSTLYEFEDYAKKNLNEFQWRFIDQPATYGRTRRDNEAAFQKLKILPDHMVPVADFTPSLTVLGQNIDIPIGIAPSAYHKVLTKRGEKDTVKAARTHNTVYIQSSLSSTRLEDIASTAPDAVRWMQIAFSSPKNMSLDIARRAEAAGCSALVVTIDWPTAPIIYDLDMSTLLYPGSPAFTNHDLPYDSIFNAEQSWDDIASLIKSTDLPVLVKGVLNPSAVYMSKQIGAAGVIVSNHGGDALDGVPASIEMLPHIMKAVEESGGGLDVYLDSGIRTGMDVFRALALGAKMVFIGRPTLHGLAYDGQKGVEQVLQILKDEFINTAQMAGTPNMMSINKHRVISQAKLDLM